MKFHGKNEEFLQLEIIDSDKNCDLLEQKIESSLTVLWSQSDKNKLRIDGKIHDFEKNKIVFLTEFHDVKVKYVESMRFLKFNRSFYCILENDSEVSCKGILFFGASQLPIVSISDSDLEVFDTLWKMFLLEMNSRDRLQFGMLQMMLKRYLILCTRLYKAQHEKSITRSESDLIREFNFLVEQHYKTKHKVSDYAALLFKSAKTISNTFSKLGNKTASQYIQDRRLLEAKRLLRYSSLQIQEIAHEIGYEDVQSFSRFFKQHAGVSPSFFKKS